ncbi:MAG: DivIVA domain-containing protein [Actinomycetia bacterium]|nr:DivIVA domain-containing protein [Actinomycetes bacterium]
MNSASIAETHRFGRVRKNGYDPAEVDAVIARLVEALRHNDERIDMLTDKIDAADASADAIRKTFVAAESTREAIIEGARVEASAITESAVEEAAELAATADGLQAEIAASRDRILTGLFEEAEERMLEIERQMAKRSVDTEWVILEAIRVRDQKVSDSEADVAAATHKAEIDAEQIRARIATMSQAALAFEKAAETLAASAKERAKVIDLTAMERLNEQQFADLAPAVEVEPETTAVDEPLVVVADIPDDTGIEDIVADDVEASDDALDNEDDSKKTRYQRTTGVPLKERIKIARMSG